MSKFMLISDCFGHKSLLSIRLLSSGWMIENRFLQRTLAKLVITNNWICYVLSTFEILKMKGLELTKIIAKIEQFSPLSLAGSWDNVGLLVEPYKTAIISKIILTNDLTESVVNECIDKNANMILSYHPPIFKPLKTLTKAAWKVSNQLLNGFLSILSFTYLLLLNK